MSIYYKIESDWFVNISGISESFQNVKTKE